MATIAQTIGYNQPLHYSIEFWTHDAGEHLADFDSTDTNPTYKIHNAVLKLNTIMHSFSFDVDNSDKSIPDWLIAPGNMVFVNVWKNDEFYYTTDSWPFAGFIDYPSEARYGFQGHKFQVVCYEAKQVIYDSNVTFVKNAPLDVIDNPASNNATKYQIWRLIKDLLSNPAYTLLADDALQDRIPFFDTSYSMLSSDVNIIYPRPKIRNQSAGVGLDEWAELIGFNWYFSYPNGNPTPVVRYPIHEYVPIVMKAGDTKDINTDEATKTSYIADPFEKVSTSSQEGNVATVLSAISKIQDLEMASKKVNTTSTAMNFKAISMPFSTTETNFTELTLTMSKFGNPESPKNRVNGAIFVNVGNKPVGRVLEFHIPLSDIETSSTNVTVDLEDLKRDLNNLAGLTDFYIVLYQRSGLDGDPNNDTANGVRWHRDTATNGGSLIAQGGDRDKHASLDWKAHGPNYVFSIKSSINRLFVATNQELAKKIGKKEPPSLDFSFIEDINVAQRYLSFILYYAALYKVPIPLKVTVPNDFLFKPYQIIPGVFETYTFPGGIDLEIQEVVYDFKENTNECTIDCLALVDGTWPTTFGCSNLV